MKIRAIYIVASIWLLAIAGCTGDFDEINTNPSKLTEAGARELPFMFSRAQSAATIHRPYYQTISILMPDLYAQYYALTTPVSLPIDMP
ncbi:hypothetical protein QT327_07520 [Olivibacter sp. 47]|uniref:hypothetical protein n=1 Tax=Olivibacter sp. 47 TaxID=3056486 RepID=UPI0025A4ABB9|nr:hypothetical protein [Olivibacter sp. 47]MDM8174205.1 hypothetical protein [Olivibacter sp. 47]